MRDKLRLILLLGQAFSGLAQTQELGSPEFTPVCNECVVLLRWRSPDGPASYYELTLSDELHPAGKRLIYKGPSTEVFVTISGPQVAELRTCLYGALCSDIVPMDLVPPPYIPDDRLLKDIRITGPVELIHDTAARAVTPSVPRDVTEPRAVLLDLTATGQRGCEKGTGNRQWNIGTRMTIQIAPDLEFKVRNRSVVEHDDGRWTWVGAIAKGYEGIVTLTASDCEAKAYVSIESDAGDFAIQPTTAPAHVAYRVGPADDPRDCSVPIVASAPPLIAFHEEAAPEDFAAPGRAAGHYRHVSFDYDALEARLEPLRYLLGSDRDHDIDKFLNPLVSLELFPGIETRLDLRHGTIKARDARRWSWSGCVAGKPDSRLNVHVDSDTRSVHLTLRDGNTNLAMTQSSEGLYLISRYGD